MTWLLHCMLAEVQCIVIGPVCLFVCGWVCYHDNSKLRASILTKLGFLVKVVTNSSWLNFGRPAPTGREPVVEPKFLAPNFWLHLTAASVQCLHLSERFFHCVLFFLMSTDALETWYAAVWTSWHASHVSSHAHAARHYAWTKTGNDARTECFTCVSGVLDCWWWRFDCSCAGLIAPVVTTTSIILSFSQTG